MIFALDIDETQSYSLERDTDETKTLFRLGVVDGVLLSAIEDTQTQFALHNANNSGTPDICVNVHGKNVEVVKFGLKGWENLKDTSKNDIPFKTQSYNIPRVGERKGVHGDCLKLLSKDVLTELAGEILKASEQTKVQEKN